jgi:hypothetical protein
MHARQVSLTRGALLWMEFKVHSLRMIVSYLIEARNIDLQGTNSFVTFKATPMISVGCSQENVAHGQFCFGDVSPDKISVLGAESHSTDALPGKQKTRTTIQKQLARIGNRDGFRVPMMFATAQKMIIPNNSAMPHHQIIVEHICRGLSQLAQRRRAKFDFQFRFGGKTVRAIVEKRLKLSLGEECRAFDEDVKLKIVVGPVSARGSQDTSFAPSVTAAQEHCFQKAGRNYLFDRAARLRAENFQMRFKFVAAVKGEVLSRRTALAFNIGPSRFLNLEQ